MTVALCAFAAPAAAAPRTQARVKAEPPPRSGAPSDGGGARHPCTVARVSDGDTLVCADRTKVRLLLIDAPEALQAPWGAQAKTALTRLAPVGSTVFLESDVRPTDPYGRALAYVWLGDGRMANELLARDGYVLALTYPPNVRYVDRIRAAVESAKSNRRGLWSTSAFACSPKDFRKGRCR